VPCGLHLSISRPKQRYQRERVGNMLVSPLRGFHCIFPTSFGTYHVLLSQRGQSPHLPTVLQAELRDLQSPTKLTPRAFSVRGYVPLQKPRATTPRRPEETARPRAPHPTQQACVEAVSCVCVHACACLCVSVHVYEHDPHLVGPGRLGLGSVVCLQSPREQSQSTQACIFGLRSNMHRN
jgi:hypothetical protein